MEFSNANYYKKALVFLIISISLGFCTLTDIPLSANINFVLINNSQKEQNTYLQVEVHNNSEKNYYLYNPIFKVIVKNGRKEDTLSITSLWGKDFLGDINPFIFEPQDSITLKFRKFMRESANYKSGKLNESLWSEAADQLIVNHTPMVYFIKSNESLKLKYYIGKLTNKGEYNIIVNSFNSKDEINNYLPEKFNGFELYKNQINLNEFSFLVE